MRLKNRTGFRYGKLKVLDYAGEGKWLCLCDCGEYKEIPSGKLTKTGVKSCGCGQGGGSHNKTDTKEYQIWKGMKARCYNPNHKSFKFYGARGISVQESWIESFENFLMYVGEAPEGYSLDRIDNSKGYQEGNVRWVNSVSQARNKAMYQTNKSGVTGVTKRVKYGIDSWVCSWYEIDGKIRSRSFSLNKYGEELAFFLACEYRDLMLQRLNILGAGYSEHHGK